MENKKTQHIPQSIPFIKENAWDSIGSLSGVLTVMGMNEGQRLEVRAGEHAAVLLKRPMTALEMVQAIRQLEALSEDLLVHLAKACGPCDGCEEDCPYFQDEELIRLPEALLKEAGYAQDAILDASIQDGVIVVTEAEGPDLRSVPQDLLAMLRQAGVCLDELDAMIVEERTVYGE